MKHLLSTLTLAAAALAANAAGPSPVVAPAIKFLPERSDTISVTLGTMLTYYSAVNPAEGKDFYWELPANDPDGVTATENFEPASDRTPAVGSKYLNIMATRPGTHSIRLLKISKPQPDLIITWTLLVTP